MRRREKIAATLAFAGLALTAIASPIAGCASSSKDCAQLGKPEGCGGGDTTSTTTKSTTSSTTTDSTTTSSNTGGMGGMGGSGGMTNTGGTGGSGGMTTSSNTGGTGTGGGDAGPAVSALPTCGTKVFGDTVDQAVRAIATDASGTVIAGEFLGKLDVGLGAMDAGPGVATFVARLDDSLTAVWSKSFRVPFKAMAVGPQGDVVIAGDLTAMTNFGCAAQLDPLNGNFYIARFDVNGTCKHAKEYTATVPRARLAIDANDNLVLAGSVTGASAFGKSITPHGGEDILVARFDSNGLPLNARAIGGLSNDTATGVVVDTLGKVYVTGTYQGTVDFVTGGAVLNSNGHVGVFAAGFNASLGSSWATGLTSPNDASSVDLVLTPAGELALGGTFVGSITLGGTTTNSTGMGSAFFLGRVDTSGAGKGMSIVDGLTAGDISAMAVNTAGDVAIAGSRPEGLYLARFDAAGTSSFTGHATGTGTSHRATAAAWSSAGKLLLGGFFDGSLATTLTQSVQSNGGTDVLVFQICFPP